MNPSIKITLLFICAALTACTSYGPLLAPVEPVAVKKTPRVDAQAEPEPEPAAHSYPADVPPEIHVRKAAPVKKAPAPKQPAAVLALLDAAESERQSGQLDTAAATLERAIRIQPRNAKLWHRMAALRLEQEKPRLALDLARKSDTLAGQDSALKRENAQIIEEAKRLLGDLGGAGELHEEAGRQTLP